MEQDADVYFAQHDIPSVVSDMLFELGFHRPKDVGKFLAGYVDRRFKLEGGARGAAAGDERMGSLAQSQPGEEDFSTIEVQSVPGSMGKDEATACALLEEARSLRRKYRNFKAGKGRKDPGEADTQDFQTIPWSEFRTDYERLLLVLQSPQVWSFCERRLAHLRGLFDAHCALNAAAEEAEVTSAPPPPRVDNCVQLGRVLAPNRLMHLYRKKADSEAAGSSEVLPGQTLNDIVGRLGRPPGPEDLTLDADAAVQGVQQSLRAVFSRTSNHLRGQFVAEAAAASFRLIEATDAAGSGEAFAEYRLPLHPESGAWTDLARWAEEFDVRSPRVRWVAQLPQNAYAGLKERRSVLSFGELLDNLFGPPIAAVQHADDPEAQQLSKLLEEVAGFEVLCVDGVSDHRIGAEADAEPEEWSNASSPPFAYQIYHVWTRLKVLNACRVGASLPALGLRAAANTAEPLGAAYLLGVNTAARCGALGVHAPLQYLFLLDGLVATVSLCSRRSLGGAGEAGHKTFERLFKAGIGVALCSEDKTVSAQCDDALGHEYALARSALGLSQADLAEIARCSSLAADRSQASEGRKGSRTRTEKSVRQRYRLGRRDAELALLARMAPQAIARALGVPSSSGP